MYSFSHFVIPKRFLQNILGYRPIYPYKLDLFKSPCALVFRFYQNKSFQKVKKMLFI